MIGRSLFDDRPQKDGMLDMQALVDRLLKKRRNDPRAGHALLLCDPVQFRAHRLLHPPGGHDGLALGGALAWRSGCWPKRARTRPVSDR